MWAPERRLRTPARGGDVTEGRAGLKLSVVTGVSAIAAALLLAGVASAGADQCVECHRTITAGVVGDWQISKHAQNGVTCDVCHGAGHLGASDAVKAKLPTAETCAGCHQERYDQFKRGKHAAAWASMQAMPTTHALPVALREGMKGCGGCHKLGLKSAKEIAALEDQGGGHGNASCDACHTRHAFSLNEARRPQACQTGHMGFDHNPDYALWYRWSEMKRDLEEIKEMAAQMRLDRRVGGAARD